VNSRAVFIVNAGDVISLTQQENRMTAEVSNEFEAQYHDRVRRIRHAAAAAIRELSLFRSGGPVTIEVLDAEVARISKEKLEPHGCDLVVDRMDDGVTRFLINVRSTGRRYDLIRSFFHRDEELTL
jgi:uncharacterized protein (DUF2267 family)